MNLCRDCKSYEAVDQGLCNHGTARDPVNGLSRMTALDNRTRGFCGPEGRFWWPRVDVSPPPPEK